MKKKIKSVISGIKKKEKESDDVKIPIEIWI